MSLTLCCMIEGWSTRVLGVGSRVRQNAGTRTLASAASSLLKKVSGTLPITRNQALFRRSESSRHLFQQAATPVLSFGEPGKGSNKLKSCQLSVKDEGRRDQGQKD